MTARGGNGLLKWTIYSADDPRLLPPAPGQEPRADSLPAPERSPIDLFTLRQRLGFQYPHAPATVEPAIKRISEVIWTANEADDPSQLSLGLTGPQSQTRHATAPRKFSALAAVRIGDAHHRLLENLELADARGLDTLERAAREMCGAGLFTADEFKALNLPAIHQFWTSDIGQKILACPEDQVQRELPFTLRLTPEDLAEHGLCANANELQGETFIGRGQIDLAVILPKEIWLLDFKTDRVKQTELDAKVAPYSRQLKLYALAVQRIYGRPVTHRWLHFLSIGKSVAV